MASRNVKELHRFLANLLVLSIRSRGVETEVVAAFQVQQLAVDKLQVLLYRLAKTPPHDVRQVERSEVDAVQSGQQRTETYHKRRRRREATPRWKVGVDQDVAPVGERMPRSEDADNALKVVRPRLLMALVGTEVDLDTGIECVRTDTDATLGAATTIKQDRSVYGHGHNEALVVIRVVPDQVYPSRGPDHYLGCRSESVLELFLTIVLGLRLHPLPYLVGTTFVVTFGQKTPAAESPQQPVAPPAPRRPGAHLCGPRIVASAPNQILDTYYTGDILHGPADRPESGARNDSAAFGPIPFSRPAGRWRALPPLPE